MAFSVEAQIHDYFGYPEAVHRSVNVLVMNPWVYDYDFDYYIPGEIAVVGFSIRRGRFTEFSKIIDPKHIPNEDVDEADLNQEIHRFPPPQDRRTKKYYEVMVQKFESNLLETQGKDEKAPAEGYFLFAREEDIESFTCGMKWLYKKAGKTFEMRILSLELLVEVLIIMGLESQENQNCGKADVDVEWDQYDIKWYLRPHMNRDLNRKSLACSFHQDRIDLMSDAVKKWWMDLQPEQRPGGAFAECALLKAQKQVFLALEMVVPYFPHIRETQYEGSHFPKSIDE